MVEVEQSTNPVTSHPRCPASLSSTLQPLQISFENAGDGQLTMAKLGLQASTASRIGRVPGVGNSFPALRSSFTSSRTKSHNWW